MHNPVVTLLSSSIVFNHEQEVHHEHLKPTHLSCLGIVLLLDVCVLVYAILLKKSIHCVIAPKLHLLELIC